MLKKKYIQLKDRGGRPSFLSKFVKKNLALILTTFFLVTGTAFFNLYSEKTLGSYGDMIITKSYDYSSIPIYWVKSAVSDIQKAIFAKHLNEELIKENYRLKQQLVELELLQKQIVELKKITNYIDNSKVRYTSARIIASNIDALGAKLVVNAGSLDGIREGDIVINDSGVAGRVISVSEYSSRIMLVVDGFLKIPVLLLKSGLHCVVGEPNSINMLKLLYRKDKKIEPIIGEHAVTSGEDGSIPFGIKVGTIVKGEDGTPMLKSDVIFSDLEIVSILQLEPGTDNK